MFQSVPRDHTIISPKKIDPGDKAMKHAHTTTRRVTKIAGLALLLGGVDQVGHHWV